MLGHQRTLRADPKFRPDMRQLADSRSVTDVQVTVKAIHALIAGNPFGKGARRAFCASTELVFGLARMFELGRINPADEFRVFRTMNEARAWLGLPPES